jgi:hypothetical protein
MGDGGMRGSGLYRFLIEKRVHAEKTRFEEGDFDDPKALKRIGEISRQMPIPELSLIGHLKNE